MRNIDMHRSQVVKNDAYFSRYQVKYRRRRGTLDTPSPTLASVTSRPLLAPLPPPVIAVVFKAEGAEY